MLLGAWWCGTPGTLHLAPCTWHLGIGIGSSSGTTEPERESKGPPLHSFLPDPDWPCQTIHPNPNTTTTVAADTQTSPSQSRPELPALRLGPRCSRLSTALLLCLDSTRQQRRPTFKMREIVSCPRPQKTTSETRRRPMLLSHPPLPLSLSLPHHRDRTHGQASKHHQHPGTSTQMPSEDASDC